MAGADRLGRPALLTDVQVAEVEAVLLAGPKQSGYATDMWTLARIAEVIERMTGVSYSQTQTWTILRRRLGWTRQRPARRALARDDAAIESWVKQDWPRIKRGPAAAELLLLRAPSRAAAQAQCRPVRQ